MPKDYHESYADYQKRVLDPISKSFCAAKWYNATIWLGSGTTTSCHHPLGKVVDREEVRQNPKVLHNTEHKKEMRRLMLKGERPQECEYCWKIEDMNRENVSDRIFKTIIYEDHEIAELQNFDVNKDINLKTLEVAFDRTCNFACSYCNPSFSSTWANDIRRDGPYLDLETDGRNHFSNAHDTAQPFAKNEINPYIEAFWKWWPELSTSLKELRVTGGEPLLSPDFWRLLDYFLENCSSSIDLAVNTNLGSKDEVIAALIEKSRFIKNFDLYTSCEAVGPQAEYIRDGLNFERYLGNLKKVIEGGSFRRVHVMLTINALCLFSLPEFLDILVSFKEKFGPDKPNWSINILRFPSFQGPLVLPSNLREERRESLIAWYEKNKAHPCLHEMEVVSVQRLIDYLDVVKTPHSYSSPRWQLEKDFKSFFSQYDRRRGKDFFQSFSREPKLLQWYRSIRKNPGNPQGSALS